MQTKKSDIDIRGNIYIICSNSDAQHVKIWAFESQLTVLPSRPTLDNR